MKDRNGGNHHHMKVPRKDYMNLKSIQSAILGIAICTAIPARATVLTEAQKPSAEAFTSMRYGNFTHIVYRLSIGPDGGKNYQSPDAFADMFDVAAYADQLKSMGVEYVIFTAWHLEMYNLGPNSAMDKWLPGHTTKRDLIGEIADALHQHGIKMIIYAHPNDGHDLTTEEQAKVGFVKPAEGVNARMPVFNDFLNEVYAELAARYAKKTNLLGFWWDSWGANGGAIDMPRLRRTLLQAMPRAIVLSNFFNPDFIDFNSMEKYYPVGGLDNIDNLLVQIDNQSTVFAGGWWCGSLGETSLYSPESLFKFTVLNACGGAPGGMAWAISPTCDGKTWSSGNVEVMRKLGRYIEAIRPTLCGVAPSWNWPVDGNTTLNASRGYGATRSLDGTKEYVHVLKAPNGKSLDLEPTAESFKSARLFSNGHSVKIKSTPEKFRLTLGANDQWNALNTVIVLEGDPSGQNLRARSKTVQHGDAAITYKGAWDANGSHHYTQTAGAAAEITFTGTKFAWYGVTGDDHGIANVIIDGAAPVEVDCYSPGRNDSFPCYSARLPFGKHTVRIENSGKKNPEGKGQFIEIQRLELLASPNPEQAGSPEILPSGHTN